MFKKLIAVGITSLLSQTALAGGGGSHLVMSDPPNASTQSLLMTCVGRYEGETLKASIIGDRSGGLVVVDLQFGNDYQEIIPAFAGISSSLPEQRASTVPLTGAISSNNRVGYFKLPHPSAQSARGEIGVRHEFGVFVLKVDCLRN